MKKALTVLGIVVMVVSLSVFMTGCAKEQLVKEEALVSEEKAAGVPEAVVEEALVVEEAAPDAAKLKEIALKEASAFEDILFDFDKYDLRPAAREVLRKHAEWLARHADFDVIIEGHCDERGTREYNLALGERRAETASNYLVNLGVDTSRVTTISYGEELPVDPRHIEAAWTKNRRAHFVVVTE